MILAQFVVQRQTSEYFSSHWNPDYPVQEPRTNELYQVDYSTKDVAPAVNALHIYEQISSLYGVDVKNLNFLEFLIKRDYEL